MYPEMAFFRTDKHKDYPVVIKRYFAKVVRGISRRRRFVFTTTWPFIANLITAN